jgi:hypothetical protein
MTSTFTFASYIETSTGTVLVHGIRCDHYCPIERGCEDAQMYMGYCDHVEAAKAACGCDDFDVNLSNANALDVLNRLGLDADPEALYGDIDPDDLLSRAMVANVGLDDSGVASVEDVFGNGARMIDCGRRAGYFDDVMARLADLAVEAKRRNVLIGWS